MGLPAGHPSPTTRALAPLRMAVTSLVLGALGEHFAGGLRLEQARVFRGCSVLHRGDRADVSERFDGGNGVGPSFA